MLSLVLILKQQINEWNSIKLINGENQRNIDQILNLLFLQRHDQSQKLRIKIVKHRPNALQRD